MYEWRQLEAVKETWRQGEEKSSGKYAMRISTKNRFSLPRSRKRDGFEDKIRSTRSLTGIGYEAFEESAIYMLEMCEESLILRYRN